MILFCQCTKDFFFWGGEGESSWKKKENVAVASHHDDHTFVVLLSQATMLRSLSRCKLSRGWVVDDGRARRHLYGRNSLLRTMEDSYGSLTKHRLQSPRPWCTLRRLPSSHRYVTTTV